MRRGALAGALVALLALGASPLPTSWPEPPTVTARSFLLIDAHSGQVLAGHRADVRGPVASTVKVLTAYTALTRVSPGELVEVGAEVADLEGASVGLRPGDRWSVRDLVAAVLVRSGNDAAVALAVHVGGSVEGFLELMRRDAAELGLEGPTLATPSGLDDRNLLSARDLAVVTRAAMALPLVAELAAAPDVDLPGQPDAPNRNELLLQYPGAIGVKTGYTAASGWSVIGAADRDGRSLLAVVLGSSGHEERFEDAAALLDHGYERFVSVVATRSLRLRTADGWVEVVAEAPARLVPRDAPDVEVALAVPVELAEVPEEVAVSWRGNELTVAPVEMRFEEEPRRPGSGSAALSRFLMDRAYAALRGATAATLWGGR